MQHNLEPDNCLFFRVEIYISYEEDDNMERLYTEKEVIDYMVRAAEAAVEGYRRGLQKSILINTATALMLAPAIILVTKIKRK